MVKNINFSNLDIRIEENDNEAIFWFNGDVDENFRQEVVPRIKKDRITFELENINNFNSCGIREWIYLIRDISKLGELVFRKCSVIMIDQINLVPDSLGTGTIESFYAPYYCECSGEVSRLINVNDSIHDLNNKTAPIFHCDKCKSELEFDALEESYFLFANKALPKVG